MEPKVLLFTDADVFAGTERHIFDLARALRSQEVRVAVACPAPSPLAERVSSAGVDVVPVAKRGQVDWRAVRTLRRLLRRGEFDLIHAHNGRTALAAALAVRLAKRGRCVMTQHFLEPAHVTRRGLCGLVSHAIHGWLNGAVDHFIAVSRAAQDGMLRRRDAHSSRIAVVPHGIVPPDLAALPPAPQVRASLGVGADVPLVACAARLEPEKDVGSLVEAMIRVRAARPDAVCVIAGDGSCRPALERQVSAAGAGQAIRLLGFRTDVLSIVAASDLFALPSAVESFGLSVVEAMAAGKAVVATRAGGPAEVVADGETGLLVPPADPPALAAAIARLLGDSDLRHRMGRAGRERFERQFTAARMAAATAAVYRRVLGTGVGSAATASATPALQPSSGETAAPPPFADSAR